MGTYSLRHSWGLAIDSSPPLWCPRFAIILQTRIWEGEKKFPDRTSRVIPREGVGQGKGQALSPP